VRRGDDRHRAVQTLLGDPVEMIAVIVRQDDEVERRQLVDLARGLGEPLGDETVAARWPFRWRTPFPLAGHGRLGRS